MVDRRKVGGGISPKGFTPCHPAQLKDPYQIAFSLHSPKMHFTIKITEDLICPWCYISSHRLRRAIASYLSSDASEPRSTFSLSFTAFQLDPSLPAPGVAKAEYLRQHLGSKANAEAARARVREGAAKANVIIHPTEEEACVGNTLDGHRLVWWAGSSYLEKHSGKGALFLHAARGLSVRMSRC